MKEYRVIKSRKTDSENPITVSKGEKLTCGEESNKNGDWAGWVFCRSENNEGWLPRQIIERTGDIGIILEDYDAREFDIEVDEIIVMDKKMNGWIWGSKKADPLTKAWAPLNHLEEV